MINPDFICENCAFWEPAEFNQKNYGYCHRYPPVFQDLESRKEEDYFPVTRPFDWCGEFRKQPAIRKP